MAGNIVTANVGATAGGTVLPEGRDASYATWPSFAQKTLEDIISIYSGNTRRSEDGTVGKDQNRIPATQKPKVTTAIFSQDTFILIGLLVLGVVGLRMLAR
jgi:hypothetical protein